MRYLYNTYQLLIALPLIVIETVIICSCIIVGAALGFGHFWANYPPRLWARIILWLLFIPVKVEGRNRLDPKESYVFVANHQGAFDIFLIYGFLGRNFKWMMKHQILKIPFVGQACKASRQIIIDKRGPKRIKDSYDKAREVLKDGISLVVFPEGARSFTGHMGKFTRGAFMLADELQLPVVPLTINGSFNVLPRTNDWHFVDWHPLSLTIHQPLYPVGQGTTNITTTLNDSYEAVMSGLVPEYQGFQENPDQ